MWREPKVNWSASDFCTSEDMNRIYGNVTYLLTHTEPTVTFTADDIVTLSEWQYIRNNVTALAKIFGVSSPAIDDRASYDNFNNVERLISRLKQPIDRKYNMRRSNKYAGNYYAGSVRIGGVK